MRTRSQWIIAVVLTAAIVVVGAITSARAADITWTGAGDGSSWTDPNNWQDNTTMLPGVPVGTDQAFINNVAVVNIDA